MSTPATVGKPDAVNLKWLPPTMVGSGLIRTAEAEGSLFFVCESAEVLASDGQSLRQAGAEDLFG